MGYWTYTLANRKLETTADGLDFKRRCVLEYGHRAVVVCPDDTHIIEPYYDGYGIFGGYDIFELLVEWNKDHLEEIYDQLEENAAKQYGENNRHKFWGSQYRDIAIAYQNGDMDKVEELIKQLPSQQQHDEWMRDIGISIDKEWIPYPIKIVSNVRGIKKYKDLPVSHYTQ